MQIDLVHCLHFLGANKFDFFLFIVICIEATKLQVMNRPK